MDNEYEIKRARSLTQDDINTIASTMQTMKSLSANVEGAVTVMNDAAEVIAEVWWDEESEVWLVDMEVVKPEETL